MNEEKNEEKKLTPQQQFEEDSMRERILMLRLKHGNDWPEVKEWDKTHGGPPTDVTVATEDLEAARARVKSAEAALAEAKKEETAAAQRLDETQAAVDAAPTTEIVVTMSEGEVVPPPPLPPGETVGQGGTNPGGN